MSHPSTIASGLHEALWFGDPNPQRSREDASRALAATVGRATGLRPFPVAAAQVLSLLVRPSYEVADVEAAVASDPALTMRFLRVANSALYRRAAPCTTLRAALARIGEVTIRDVAAAIATMAMFDDATGAGAVVRDHCARVAAIGRILAREWRLKDADQVFVCGLLHDVGKLLWMQTGEMSYADMPEAPHEAHVRERAATGFDHAVLAANVLDAWKIPPSVSQVVALHHQAGRAFEIGGAVGVTVALLGVADEVEYRVRRHPELDEAFLSEVASHGDASYLGFTAADLRAVWSAMVDATSDLGTLFG